MIIDEMVIACFPDLLPDETWQSVCTRFIRRMRYPITTTYLRLIQDSNSHFPSPDFPSKIDQMTSRITSGVTSIKIIQDHTLYPLHAPFLSEKQRQALISAMSDGGNPIRLLGLVNFAAYQPRHLRFCPKCIKNDLELHGEPYWHRVHQVGFSKFCPHHSISLVESSIAFRPYVFQTGLPICDQALCNDLSKQVVAGNTNSRRVLGDTFSQSLVDSSCQTQK
jgi:TniQ